MRTKDEGALDPLVMLWSWPVELRFSAFAPTQDKASATALLAPSTYLVFWQQTVRQRQV